MKKDNNITAIPNYVSVLEELKAKIKKTQYKTALSINKKLILLYWEIGAIILTQQKEQGWGSKVIEHLSKDLSHSFPGMKGFSPRNLKYMRKLAEMYVDEVIVQQLVAQIPWGHNVRLLDSV